MVFRLYGTLYDSVYLSIISCVILHRSLETSNLDCDCSLIWFKDWLKSKRLEDRDVSCTCASPAWLKGKDMTTLLNSELTCGMWHYYDARAFMLRGLRWLDVYRLGWK